MSFDELGLTAELLRAVAEQGYTVPTPIQAQAIPVVLAGRDLLGAAQTGTGKTAGFTLPLLQRLTAQAEPRAARRPVRALVLVPTRELAAQVHESVRAYGRHLNLRAAVIYGGVSIKPQVEALARGADIVIATPGRLLDHLGQKTIDLRQVRILVLDEADRMLDMGFIRDIRRILALLPRERQNLLFSATFPDEIRRLAADFLRDPVTVEVARRNAPIELVSQVVHPVRQDRKRELLAHLVTSGGWNQVLVFTRTKHGANRLAEQLERDGIDAAAIHGNKSQGARTRALGRFKSNELQVLVATDIAARGLDIDLLPHVVNYDLPHVPEDYVHRIGRTGRAGATGEAVSLVTPEDRPLLAAIERLIGARIEQRSVPGFEAAGPQGAQREAGHRIDARPSGGKARERRSNPGAAAAQARGPAGAGRERDAQARSDIRRHPRRRGDGESTGNGKRRTVQAMNPDSATGPATVHPAPGEAGSARPQAPGKAGPREQRSPLRRFAAILGFRGEAD